MGGENNGQEHVMALDVGTTTIRAMVYNRSGVVVGTAATPVRYSSGRTEIDPGELWEDSLRVLRNSLQVGVGDYFKLTF